VETLFQGVRDSLSQPDTGLYEANTFLSTLASAELDLQRYLRELRTRYLPDDQLEETHLRWAELAGPARITSHADLEQILKHISTQIQAELGRNRTVIIE